MIEKPKINVSFQAIIKNKKVLFMCYLNLNLKVKRNQVKHVRPNSTRFTKDTENVKYKQEVISSGISIPQAFYDKANKQCLGQYAYLNSVFPELKKGVISLYEKYYTSSLFIDLFKDEIKRYLKSQLQTTDTKVQIKEVSQLLAPTCFVKYINYKIKEWCSGLSPKTPNTIVNHTKFKNWILKYEQEKNVTLDLLSMNNNSLKDFIIWVSAKSKSDGQPFKLSYINYFKTQFKVFINEAINEDDMDLPNLNLNKKFMCKKTEETDDIYLRLNQLKMIEALSFGEDRKIAGRIARSIFTWLLYRLQMADTFHFNRRAFKRIFKWSMVFYI